MKLNQLHGDIVSESGELNCAMCGNTQEWHLNPDGSSRVRHKFTPGKKPKPAEKVAPPPNELNCRMCGNTKEWHIYPEGHPKAGYSRVRHMFTPNKKPKPSPDFWNYK